MTAHSTRSATERRPHEVRLTDEQFRRLWDLYPHDETLIAEACREALYTAPTPPNRKGVWPKYGVRVYIDEYGFNASGYMLVHWDDAKRVDGPWLSNGYCEDRDFRHENIEWDTSDDDERQRRLSLRRTLQHWAWL